MLTWLARRLRGRRLPGPAPNRHNRRALAALADHSGRKPARRMP